MSWINHSCAQPTVFFLTGIPGLEPFHIWISLPFFIMYITAVLGNSVVLFIIKTKRNLHKPMYYFLSMLAITDLVLSSSILPKIIGIFWFNDTAISFHTCLLQMFFIHSFTGTESALLVVMAFDRYVAICEPLRYDSILTNLLIAKIGLLACIRNMVLTMPFLILAKRLPFCGVNVISHTYCEHMAVVKLAHADIIISSTYGITIALFMGMTDIMLITLSYVMILRAVLRLPSQAARHKAFNTCTAHICVILVFYTPEFFSFLTHRYGHHVAPHLHILLSNLYLLIPPMLNPLVYGAKTKEIRDSFIRLFHHSKIRLNHLP